MPPVTSQLQQEKYKTNPGHDCESRTAHQRKYKQKNTIDYQFCATNITKHIYKNNDCFQLCYRELKLKM